MRWLRSDTLERRFRDWIGVPVSEVVVHRASLPGYRFVDVFRALTAVAE